MSDNLPPPAVGKLVTIIAVSGGEPVVTFGEVLVSKSNIVAVAVNIEQVGLARFRDCPTTILYGAGDDDLILRGRVTEVVAPDRIIVSTPGPPRPGERREYIRTDMELGVRLEKAPGQQEDAAAVREWIEGQSDDPARFNFVATTVDLSGSGARFTLDCSVRKGDVACVSFLLEKNRPRPVLHLPATIVRSRPANDDSPRSEVALTFRDMSESERDLLNYVVFESRARQLGVSAMHILEEG